MTLLLVDYVRICILLLVFLDSKHYVGFDCRDHDRVFKDGKMLYLFTIFILPSC